MSKLLYLDLVGGAAGDMLLAALLDAGADRKEIERAHRAAGVSHVEMLEEEANPAGLRAKRIKLAIDGETSDDHNHLAHGHGHGHRPYFDIRDRLKHADLYIRAKQIALDAFSALGEAESLAHGIPIEEVVFHEVGADDAIADIVGVAQAVVSLGIDQVVCSPIPLGRGLTKGAHGPIPLPAPATLHILKGAPLAETPLAMETVTPTGAALLKALVTSYGPIPAMTIDVVGVGAGHAELGDRPNVVRAFLGSATAAGFQRHDGEVLLESNIDDMSPERLSGLTEALVRAGAIDVWTSVVSMKKSRTGTVVTALVPAQTEEAVAVAFFVHSTTLGIRKSPVERLRAIRKMLTVSTEFGEVRVKVADRPSGPPLVMPEHDDCRSAASAAGVSERAVFEAAQRAAWSQLDG